MPGLQSGEYGHTTGISGEQWDQTKQAVDTALNLKHLVLFFYLSS